MKKQTREIGCNVEQRNQCRATKSCARRQQQPTSHKIDLCCVCLSPLPLFVRLRLPDMPPKRNYPDWYPRSVVEDKRGGKVIRRVRVTRFAIPAWNALSDEQRDYVRQHDRPIMPATMRNREDAGGQKEDTAWQLQLPRNNAVFYDKINHVESKTRVKFIRSLCGFKLLLAKGCGNQGHLQCILSKCNLVVRDILDACPEGADEMEVYLKDQLSTTLQEWYETDHFIALAKTFEFTQKMSLFKWMKEHRK